VDSEREDHPRRYQSVGLGLSLVEGGGVLVVSMEIVLAQWLQASVSAGLPDTIGARLRVVPRDGRWSPFLGVGVAHSWVLSKEPQASTDYAWSDVFDRSVSLDAGVQVISPGRQVDIGLVVIRAWPRDRRSSTAVLPVLGLKFFL
jgi:hypothetical protein